MYIKLYILCMCIYIYEDTESLAWKQPFRAVLRIVQVDHHLPSCPGPADFTPVISPKTLGFLVDFIWKMTIGIVDLAIRLIWISHDLYGIYPLVNCYITIETIAI